MCSLKLGAFNDERAFKYLEEEGKPLEEVLSFKCLYFILEQSFYSKITRLVTTLRLKLLFLKYNMVLAQGQKEIRYSVLLAHFRQ